MNSFTEVKTDSKGKFSVPVEIKYLYNNAYWIAVLVQMKKDSIKNAFGGVLKPGEMTCSKEVSLKDEALLRLNFSAHK